MTTQTFDLTGPAHEYTVPVAAAGDHERALRRQAAVAELARRAAAPNIRLVIQDSAALVAESLAAERFGFAQLSEDHTKLEMRLAIASASDEPSSREVHAGEILSGDVSFDPARSIAGYALQTGEIVAVEDLASDRRFNDEWLLEKGIRSAVVVPLRFGDEAYGVLGAFDRRARQFGQDDLHFAEMIAHLVSTNIARDRANKIFEAERRFTNTVLETVDALVLVLSATGKIIRANPACERMTGYSSGEVRDRTIWSALLVPGEADTLKSIFARLQSDPGPMLHEGYLLTKHAERRRVAWSFGLLTQSGGNIETILATGIDISERRAAEEEIERLKSSEAEAQRRLQTVLEELELQRAVPGKRALSAVASPSAGDEAGWQSENNPFQALPRGSRGDRRKRPRRSFTYYQRIAPIDNGRIPPLRMFRRVKCLDISAGGFSFLSSVQPSDKHYVVALGSPPVVINVAAEVIHITPTDHEGQTTYLVGCRYTGRLDY